MVIISHTFALYRQCSNCGGSQHRNKLLPSKKYDSDIRGEFDNDKFEMWKE